MENQRISKLLFVIFAICLLIGIGTLYPVQLPVVMFKACLVMLAALVGHWLDYSLNYIIAYRSNKKINELSPDTERLIHLGASISRSILIVGCILGMCLAV